LRRFIIAVILGTLVAVPDTFAEDPQQEAIQQLVDAVSIEHIGMHIEALANAGGHQSRVTFTPGKDSAAVYIMNYLNSLPYLTSVDYDTFYIAGAVHPYNRKPLINVVAVIEGSTYPEKILVVGAHYDSSADREGSSVWMTEWKTIQAPGADDNATGVAAILEMARILGDPSFGYAIPYTIHLVAFAAEERGVIFTGNHHGSRHYAKSAREQDKDIVGMISVDMVGYNEFYDYTAIVSNASSTWLGEKLIDANARYDISLLMNQPPFPEAVYSDHDTFWNEGYDAILVIENAPPWQDSDYYIRNPYYHTSSDTYDKVNTGLVRRVTQVNLAAAASIGIGTSVPFTDGSRDLPGEFRLSQNYPNPFNPVTQIEFSLPERSEVSLKVYTIHGQIVETMVEGSYDAGSYRVRFNAGGLSSGVYMYTLSVNGTRQTKLMTLVR
jgi:hypothetical protein